MAPFAYYFLFYCVNLVSHTLMHMLVAMILRKKHPKKEDQINSFVSAVSVHVCQMALGCIPVAISHALLPYHTGM